MIAATDGVTDVGRILEENRCGWWCGSRNIKDYFVCLDSVEEQYLKDKFVKYGVNARKLLKREYRTKVADEIIVRSYKTDS